MKRHKNIQFALVEGLLWTVFASLVDGIMSVEPLVLLNPNQMCLREICRLTFRKE